MTVSEQTPLLQLKAISKRFGAVQALSEVDFELYAGEVSARGETTLPRSWTVDANPGPEVMLIVFSRAPLSPSEMRTARDHLPRTARLWATRVSQRDDSRTPYRMNPTSSAGVPPKANIARQPNRAPIE